MAFKTPRAKRLESSNGLVPKGKDKPAWEILSDMRRAIISEVSGKTRPDSLKVTPDVGDEADLAGDESSREISLLLTARNKAKLADIDSALEKIRKGIYGICEECEDRIEPGRLRVMPLARFCVSCQSVMEREMSFQDRDEEGLQLDSDFEAEEAT